MRKKTKMSLSLVLTAAMAAGLLSGCVGQGSQSGGSSDTGKATSAASAASDATSESGSGEDTAGTEERQTFKIATVRWTDAWPTDFLKEGFMKELEDKHNINIEWQVYYAGDWSEQKSLLLASGDLPDAFFGSLALNASDVSQNQSYFIDLTDKIEANMPNLTAAFEESPELKAVCTSRDGKIYSLPKKLPLRPEVCGDVMFINKEWLDNLGLD
ncbi:MAG: extracellular solute-binding protein, partial [Lachnospiraceae bacterium]|nr:extracellular solute-binding protein [Lachnospiraceae bacterium]